VVETTGPGTRKRHGCGAIRQLHAWHAGRARKQGRPATLLLCRAMRAAGLILAVAASVPAWAQVDCVLPRHDEILGPPSEAIREAGLKAEQIVLRGLIPTLSEPVRLRTSLVIQNRTPRSAHLQIATWPKQEWTAGCGVITTIVGTSVGINVFFNTPGEEHILDILHRIPQRTGDLGGRPVYNGYVLLNRDGRLPVVPETVKDWMDNEQRIEEKILADAQRSKDNARGNPIAELNLELAKRRLEACRGYRAKLSPAELAAPWGLATAEAEREWAPRIKQITQLPPAVQQEVNARAQQSRALERQAVVERTKNRNPAEADKLMAEARALNAKNAELMLAHQNKVAPELAAAAEMRKLAAVKGVTPDKAVQWKNDPGFFDTSNPNRIQLIAVGVGDGARANAKEVEMRRAWVQRVRESIDYDAIAKLLN
jgi:hypothetical protein